MSRHFSISGQANPDNNQDEFDLGAFPSPASHTSRFSRSSTLHGSRASSGAGSTLFSPSTLGFDNNPEDGKGDKASLLTHERPLFGRRRSRKRQWVKEWWLWEMGGCLLSVLCTITIIVLLPYLDDKPLNKWKLIMGPNTLISTLITIAKTSMLLPVAECLCQLKWRHFWLKSRPLAEIEAFDAASRGPWGAFVFPWKTKLKPWIALIGALIMVGALTMEPLAQQIVSFETKYRMPPLGELKGYNTSGVFVAQAYDMGTSSGFQNEPFKADQGVQAAFFDGVFGVGRLMPTTCLGGNCTWPNFLSLGVCSACEDVTHKYKYNDTSCGGPYDDNSCIIRNYTGINEEQGNLGDPYVITLFNKTRNTLVEGSTIYTDNLNVSWDFSNRAGMAAIVLGRFSDYKNGTDESIRNTPELTKCEINWCAKLYQNFSYQNTTASYTPYNYSRWDLPLTRQSVSPKSDTVAFKINFTEVVKKYPTFNLSQPVLEQIYDQTFGENRDERIFEVNKNDYLVTSYFFGDMLAFSLYDSPYDPYIKFEQIVGRTLLANPSIPAAFDRVANGISIRVQQSLDSRLNGSRHFVEAQSIVAETYVRIRKRWFIVPGSLVLLSVLFLVMTLLINLKDEAPSWKSATLPLLFHGLENFKELDEEETKIMLAQAKGMRTRLKENQEGSLRFMKV